MNHIRSALAALVCLVGFAGAAKIDDDLAALKQQLNVLSSKVGNLETQNKQLKDLQARIDQLIAVRNGDGAARAYSGTVYTALRVALLEDKNPDVLISTCLPEFKLNDRVIPAPASVRSCTIAGDGTQGNLTVTVQTATGTFVNGR